MAREGILCGMITSAPGEESHETIRAATEAVSSQAEPLMHRGFEKREAMGWTYRKIQRTTGFGLATIHKYCRDIIVPNSDEWNRFRDLVMRTKENLRRLGL